MSLSRIRPRNLWKRERERGGDELLTKAILKKPKAGGHPKAELMKSMAKEGKSLQEIMEAAGCSEPTARKYMKEALDEK